MKNFPKRIIICGSGNSVMEGLENGLADILRYQYTIGINEWYRFVSVPTIVGFVDYPWYRDNLERVKELPLLVGAKIGEFNSNKIQQDNTILLPFNNRELNLGKSWEKGFFKTALSGFFFLTLAIELGFTEIYLLGYDCCEVKGKTHFYQDLIDLGEKNELGRDKWRGIGRKEDSKYKGSYYNTPETINRWYEGYSESKATIYNVSEESTIECFPKLSYSEFFKKIKSDEQKISQTVAREKIKEILKERMI